MSEHEEPQSAIPRDMVPGIVKAGAVGAVVAGAIWVVKGGIVLLGQRDVLLGIDLGILFVVVQGLFAVAVIGVEELLGERGGRHAEVGLWFAYVSVFLSVVNLVVWVVAGTAAVPGTTSLAASLAWMIGAVLVGFPAMRAEILPRPWHLGLLVIGAAALPLLLVFGWAANIIGQDRILEVPVILLGAVWVAFGLELWWAGWRARWAKRQAAT
jgi:hypothetical protein